MISKSNVKFTGDVAFISVTSYPGIFKKNQNSGPVQEFLVSETITFFCVKSQFTLEEQFLIFICYLEVFHFGVEQTLINSRSHVFKTLQISLIPNFYTHMICSRLLAGTNLK